MGAHFSPIRTRDALASGHVRYVECRDNIYYLMQYRLTYSKSRIEKYIIVSVVKAVVESKYWQESSGSCNYKLVSKLEIGRPNWLETINVKFNLKEINLKWSYR